jgi:hypothetical protein
MLRSSRVVWRYFAVLLALTSVLVYSTLLPWQAAMRQATTMTLAALSADLAEGPCFSHGSNAESVDGPALPTPQSGDCEICKAIGSSTFALILPAHCVPQSEFTPAAYTLALADTAAPTFPVAPRSRAPPNLS